MPENTPVRVLVWDENAAHIPQNVYPTSIRGAIADGLNEDGGGQIAATVAHLDEPAHGITESVLSGIDVLLWWGHARHGEVADETAQLIKIAVHKGLGFIPLHSAHYSKPFKAVLNATGDLTGGWREGNPPDTEELTICAPHHPITQGLSDFVLPQEEMYGSPFGVPPFETMIFQSYFPVGGEYFPSFATTVGEGIDPAFTCGSGNGQNRGHGAGRVFYFRPGHEAFPTYFDANVRRVLRNGVLWCAKRS